MEEKVCPQCPEAGYATVEDHREEEKIIRDHRGIEEKISTGVVSIESTWHKY